MTHTAQSVTETPLLIASKGSIVNRNDFNFPAGMFLGACNDSVFLQKYINAFARMLNQATVNFDFTALQGDFFFQKYLENNRQKLNYRLKWAKKLKEQDVIATVKYPDFCDDVFDTNFLSKIFSSLNGVCFSVDNLQDTMINYLENYGYKGLNFFEVQTDVSDSIVARAVLSGVNMFIVEHEPEKFIKQVERLIKSGLISKKDIDKSVYKILLAKTWFGLNKEIFRSAEYRFQKIFTRKNKKLSWLIYEKTAALLINNKHTIPLKDCRKIKAVFYSKNKKQFDILRKSMHYYFDFQDTTNLFAGDDITHVIIAVQQADSLLSDSVFVKNLKQLSDKKVLVLINFGKPLHAKITDWADAVIQLYDLHPFSQSLAAQIICGDIKPKGKLP